MKRLFALGLALCLLLAACHQRGNDIVIEGDFTHGDNALVRLSWTSPDGTVVLDSVKMKNGHFCFTLRATDDESRSRNATPILYRLDLGHNNAITTIAQGGQHLRFTADATNLVRTYRVSGGEEALSEKYRKRFYPRQHRSPLYGTGQCPYGISGGFHPTSSAEYGFLYGFLPAI